MSKNISVYVQGKEGREINLPKASDLVVPAIFVDAESGIPYDIDENVGDPSSLSFLIYSRADRTSDPVQTIACTITTALNGKASVTFTAANSAWGAPGRYYGFFRITRDDAKVHFARKHTVINLK